MFLANANKRARFFYARPLLTGKVRRGLALKKRAVTFEFLVVLLFAYFLLLTVTGQTVLRMINTNEDTYESGTRSR